MEGNKKIEFCKKTFLILIFEKNSNFLAYVTPRVSMGSLKIYQQIWFCRLASFSYHTFIYILHICKYIKFVWQNFIPCKILLERNFFCFLGSGLKFLLLQPPPPRPFCTFIKTLKSEKFDKMS